MTCSDTAARSQRLRQATIVFLGLLLAVGMAVFVLPHMSGPTETLGLVL